jgi:hypothetical protein
VAADEAGAADDQDVRMKHDGPGKGCSARFYAVP